MATYDITANETSNYRPGDILNCPYTGKTKSIILPAGTYFLEAWGAQGGSYSTTAYGGKGGYSCGVLTLTEDTTIFINSGGAGKQNATSTVEGGFNGGGISSMGSSGGGGSDFRIEKNSLYARILVAGGGGGSGRYNNYNKPGGAGGGVTGTRGTYTTQSYYSGTPGTQTEAGKAYRGTVTISNTPATFGAGGGYNTSSSMMYVGGGGGGWYGGGYAIYSSGSGGSGYVYTKDTDKYYPNACELDESTYLTEAFTIDGESEFPSTDGNTETGHDGDGYCRITIRALENYTQPLNMRVKTSESKWNKVSSMYTKVNMNETERWIEIGG